MKKSIQNKNTAKKEASVDPTGTGAFSVIRQLKLYLIASFD